MELLSRWKHTKTMVLDRYLAKGACSLHGHVISIYRRWSTRVVQSVGQANHEAKRCYQLRHLVWRCNEALHASNVICKGCWDVGVLTVRQAIRIALCWHYKLKVKIKVQSSQVDHGKRQHEQWFCIGRLLGAQSEYYVKRLEQIGMQPWLDIKVPLVAPMDLH